MSRRPTWARPQPYAADLARLCDSTLDLVHLGLGADGHTASWPPGDPVIDIADRDVAISKLYNGFVRMTLTVSIEPATAFLITGGDKEHAINELGAMGDIPASRVSVDGTDASWRSPCRCSKNSTDPRVVPAQLSCAGCRPRCRRPWR